MIRGLLLFLLLLLVVTVSTFVLMRQPGTATIVYGYNTIEIPLILFALGLFIAFVALYFLVRLLIYIFLIPKKLQNSSHQRRHAKSMHQLQRGLTDILLGNWGQAEKELSKHADDSDIKFVNYLWAAKAAHHTGNYQHRDQLLQSAKQATTDNSMLVDMLRAEMLLDQHDAEQAIACLNKWVSHTHTNEKLALLLTQAYLQVKDWEKLGDLLPEIKKISASPNSDLAKLKYSAVMSLIEHAGTKHDMPTLDHILSKFKNEILDRTDLTLVSAQALRKTDQHQRATNLIERVLDKKWDEQIAREYGLISHENPAKSVVRAESWLDAHRDSPSLYLTLGRICRQAKLWGKAKNYLESSLNLNVSMETYAELASTHEQLDEHDDAQKYTRKGLALVQRVN